MGMRDYHLHLWPHDQLAYGADLEQIKSYANKARGDLVEEIAITEHLFRFRQSGQEIGQWWLKSNQQSLKEAVGNYWDHHCRADLDQYVEVVSKARNNLPVLLGLEVDFYPNQMDQVKQLLAPYPFDVLLGSVHWIDNWLFDDLDDDIFVRLWDQVDIDQVWEQYTRRVELLAQSSTCDVLAHPDVIKLTGKVPKNPQPFYDRIAKALQEADMAAEVSSAGWKKPVGRYYPDVDLLRTFYQYEIPITLASDAHYESGIGFGFLDLIEEIKKIGYKTLSRFEQRNRFQVKI